MADYQKIEIIFIKTANPYRRVRLLEIDFGVIKTYQDESLISMNIEICEDGDHAKAEKNAQVLAAALLKTYPGSMIFKHQDWSGKFCPRVILNRNGWGAFVTGIYDLLDATPEVKAPAYLVKIVATKLNIRKSPGVVSGIAGTVSKGSIYTIVESNGDWGKLKSGAGWISLKHVSRV